MLFQFSISRVGFLGFLAALSLGVAACNTPPAPEGASGGETLPAEGSSSGLSGDVKVDGSSTVFPISEGMAEEFMAVNPDVQITVGLSGTGGGFKKFCAGETDISNASRPIKESEMEICAKAGIEYIEMPVAYDGLSVVVNPANDWAVCLTPEELANLYQPASEGTLTRWNQVREGFPDQEIGIYAPGTDSGTYDYFVEATVEKFFEEKGTRGDGTFSEDDNVLVQGVEADANGIAFFGYAYYEENKEKLKVVSIQNDAGNCIEPSVQAIEDGSYNPLSRPIFVYVNKASFEAKPAVKAFMEYQADPANASIIAETGYIPMPSEVVAKVQERLTAMTTGSIYEGGSSVGVKLADKL